MDLCAQSWDYASENVVKSVQMERRTAEVPVLVYKDRDGRVSHHVRTGWFSPWHAAWINLRAMFVWCADFFCLMPGVAMLLAGLLLTLPMVGGPLTIGAVTFSLNWMLLGLVLAVVGLQAALTGLIARVIYDRTGRRRARILAALPYDRTVIGAIALFVAGVALAAPLTADYVRHGLSLAAPSTGTNHRAILGLMSVAFAFFLFVN